MNALEPGELFPITYGNGHQIKVFALSMRQKRRVMAIVDERGDEKDFYKIVNDNLSKWENALKICVPNPDEILDSVNEQQASEIVAKCILETRLTEDEQKKSESPHSSSAASSVRDVLESAAP